LKSIPDSVREDFPALKVRRNGKPPIYLDNACTTLVPYQVIKTVSDYYTRYPGCGSGRSRYWFSGEVSRRIEGDPDRGTRGSRQVVKDFINAESEKEIIYTSNATHAINIVALGFRFGPGDTVLLTDKEHNSNLIPWLRLRENKGIEVDFVGSDRNERFDFATLERKLARRKVKLVSMAYTSNLTGYTIPAKRIIKMAHEHGARVLLDAAQTVSHQVVDVRDLDVDFLAFSLHKMCGPRGVGVLYGKSELLGGPNEGDAPLLEPPLLGGGTVRDATYDSFSLLDPPERFETGIQNYPGQVAAGTAIQYLQRVGMDRIGAHVVKLNTFLTEELLKRYGHAGWLRIVGPQEAGERGGILTLEIRRPNATGIAGELDERSNLMVRDGALCVHAYLNKLFGEGWSGPGLPSKHRTTLRVSPYFYNTVQECRAFLATLNRVFDERGYL